METKEVESYKTLKSYKLNIVSEHLQDRHPYLELPFNDRYNPSEVNLFLSSYSHNLFRFIEQSLIEKSQSLLKFFK